MAETDFQAWTKDVQERVENSLQIALPSVDHTPQRLHQAMAYAVLGGGKRVRPLLVYAAGAVVGAKPECLAAASCAVEFIHAYSLIHDDLPCMDDDVLRRGKPTVHIQFDEATAMLAGDALQALAFETLTLCDHIPAQTRLEMLRVLSQASGSRGMAGGQAIDLASVGQNLSLPELEFMHILKTGALIRASVLLGAHCGKVDAAQLERLDRYAKFVGLAFQVVDDVLDAESTSDALGKTAGKDAAQGKPTYVSLMGLPQAKEWAEQLRQDAHEALESFGASAAQLHRLADFIVLRKS
ncbi:MAG TPA: farnesyl diphosphate synthase [Burkholderiales bacterium]|nr:farnesyl diphosphate synthase [Burkholderiales bacterium]